MQACVYCHGKGKLLFVYDLKLVHSKCYSCNGTGEVPDQSPGDPTGPFNDHVNVDNAPKLSETQ